MTLIVCEQHGTTFTTPVCEHLRTAIYQGRSLGYKLVSQPEVMLMMNLCDNCIKLIDEDDLMDSLGNLEVPIKPVCISHFADWSKSAG